MIQPTMVSFLRLCADLAPFTYGQNFQDVFALWASGMRRTGWFVEFGALGGVNVSNSYLLERLGWSGVVAEPHPGFHTQLRANRSCHVSTDCVWTETGKTLTFQAVRGRPALSTIAGLDYDDIQAKSGARDDHVLYEVQTISLFDLLRACDAPPDIDLLSIDTEGSELPILEAFDFSAYRFGTIVVEHGHSSQRVPIHKHLTRHGYVRLWTELSDHDDWYIHASRFDAPALDARATAALINGFDTVEISPNAAERYRRLARFATKLGLGDLALFCAERAVGLLGATHAVVHVEHARALDASGLAVQAVQAYRAALAIDPTNGAARGALERLTAS